MRQNEYRYYPPPEPPPPLPPMEIWHTYIDTLAWGQGSLDESSYRAFLRAVSLGITDQAACDEVSRRIQEAGSSLRPAKIKHQLESAHAYVGSGTYQQVVVQPSLLTWPKPNLDAIGRIVAEGWGLYDFWESSPVRLDDDRNHCEEIIDAIFPGDPLLCCGEKQWQFATRRREAWRSQLAELPYIVPNPMLTELGTTQSGKLSEHTLAATAARVYLIVEFDFSEFSKDGTKETVWTPLMREWRSAEITILDACAALHRALAKLLPLVLVVHSGGRSGHGWYLAYGAEPTLPRMFMEYAVSLGADKQLWCRSQFTRIPDGRRENGDRQTTYYFNPAKAVKL